MASLTCRKLRGRRLCDHCSEKATIKFTLKDGKTRVAHACSRHRDHARTKLVNSK